MAGQLARHIDATRSVPVFLVALAVGVAIPGAQAQGAPLSAARPSVLVPAGEFLPFYAPGGSKKKVSIKAFRMDVYPVSRGDYATFLRVAPEWKRGRPTSLLTDGDYLKEWQKESQHPTFSMTRVSYFAAAAYCDSRGGRLPTTLEWEYAAWEENVDAQMRWIAHPQPPRAVGKGAANRFGIHDLHGVIWEWTMDFNSSFAATDNRADGEQNRSFVCGAGALGAEDRTNYPAFLRYAMRGGLKPNYSIANLGFRCAYEP